MGTCGYTHHGYGFLVGMGVGLTSGTPGYTHAVPYTWTLTIEQEHCNPIEIDAGWEIYGVTFSADGEYVLSGGPLGVRVWRVWRVEDSKQVAMM